MGNSKQKAIDSGLVREYYPTQWSIFNHEGIQLWRNKQKNFLVTPFKLKSTISTQDLQRYKFRHLHSYYVVTVPNILLLSHLSHHHNYLIMVQWISLRLSQIESISFQEALIILHSVFKGISLLYSFYGLFEVQQDMICINQLGKVKIWLNSNLNNNHGITKQSYSSQHKKNLFNNVRKIFAMVQNKLYRGYDQLFSQGIPLCTTYFEASEYIQKYLTINQIKLPPNLNLQIIKLKLKHNLPQYPSSNHLQKTNHNKHHPSEQAINQLSFNASKKSLKQKYKFQVRTATPYPKKIQPKTSTNFCYNKKNNNQYLSPKNNQPKKTYIQQNQNYNNISTNNTQNTRIKQFKPYFENKKNKKQLQLNYQIKIIPPTNQPKLVHSPKYIQSKVQLNCINPQSNNHNKSHNLKFDNNSKQYNQLIKSERLSLNHYRYKLERVRSKQKREEQKIIRTFNITQLLPQVEVQDRLNKTLVEDLKGLIQSNVSDQSPIKVLKKLQLPLQTKQRTIESDVDEMDQPQQLFIKLNKLKTNELLDINRRQTYHFQKSLQVQQIQKLEGHSYHQKRLKVQTQQNSKEKIKKQRVILKKIPQIYCDKKQIKQSHDTFYTANDIYGIDAKYQKYVGNKSNKSKEIKKHTLKSEVQFLFQ